MALGLLGLVLYLVALNVAVTQYLAQYYGYHPLLGPPLKWHIYAPWQWLIWQKHFYESAKGVYGVIQVLFIAAVGLGFLVCVLMFGFRTRSSHKHEGIHGTAHWATEKEIRDTGLLPKKGESGAGVYVGGWTDEKGRLHYLRHNGPEHIGALAPTRSGKGVGLVVPTLLSYPHSVVVNDMKAELWNLTAGWRQKHADNEVLRFDPAAAEGSVAFNPLAEIRIGTLHEVGDAQNSVTIIVDPDGKGLVDHWAKTSHAFLTGCVLHLLYKHRAEGRVASLYDVAFGLSDPSRPIDQLYEEMLKNEHALPGMYGDDKTHPVVAAAARDMLNRPEEERGSVLSTAMSFLSLYRDPLVRRNTSRSDFTVMELMNRERPVSLYLVVRAEDKDRMKPLMRLIINQIVRVLLRPELEFVNGRAKQPHKHKLLLMLDEFPSYGKLEVFQEALAYIAGYGIKAYLIMQDVAQLWQAYGREETVMSNLHVRVAYAPNKIETAEWLSKMTGTTTVVKEHISTSGQRFGAVLQNVSRDYQEQSRPLLTPDEVLRLKAPKKGSNDEINEAGEVLVFVAGHAPIKGTQSLYFRDPTFQERSAIPPPANPTTAAATPPATAEAFQL